MSNPTVSVIIPVYNAQEGIKQCLDSLLNQSFTDFEIILLNDGSTDNSLEVIKKYAADNDFIRVIDKENEGVAKTRNKGIQLANGKYIVFIDNDDFIDSDYLERFYNAIDQEQLDIVLGGYKRVNQEMKTLFKQDLTQSEWSKYIVVAPWARIYRTSFLIDNNIQFFDYPIGEDVVFTLTAYNLTEKIKIIDYNGYNWFFNEKSISNTSQRGFNPNIDIVYFLSHLLKVAGDSKYIRYFIKRYYIWYLLFSGRAASSSSFMDQYRRIKEWVSKENIDSNLGTAIRTAVVLVMAWVVVFACHKQHTLKDLDKHELLFICLSGLATGASWLCYYKALQMGPASVVVPIDKLSLVVTVIFSYFVFHEKLNKKSLCGFICLIVGTLLMLL